MRTPVPPRVFSLDGSGPCGVHPEMRSGSEACQRIQHVEGKMHRIPLARRFNERRRKRSPLTMTTHGDVSVGQLEGVEAEFMYAVRPADLGLAIPVTNSASSISVPSEISDSATPLTSDLKSFP